MFKDILLPLTGFPDPLPAEALESAVALAKALDARIAGLAFEIDFHVPSNVIANAMLNLPGMVATARERAAMNARTSLAVVETARKQLGVEGSDTRLKCLEAEIPDLVTRHARLRDLAIIAAPESGATQQWLAETVIFGSGRPVVVLPAKGCAPWPGPGPTVGIAWDGTRPAARAIGDALPILKLASSVVVVTVLGEKELPRDDVFSDLMRHLCVHGIVAEGLEVPAGGRSIGDVLAGFATDRSLDLLVMGAYAHSRLRDFVLGGATKSMIAHPPVATFLSH